jgi:hypothetical protein
MADTNPQPISPAEWQEIAALRDVREAWGIEDDMSAEDFSRQVYAAKFHFISGSPGYCGDLYILQGDALTGYGPMVLRRDSNKALIAVPSDESN